MHHSPRRTPRLAVVTPHEVVARGAIAMLSDFPDRVTVVALPSVWTSRPSADVVLYDTVALHDSDGADLDHLIRHTGVKVLLYSRDLRPDLRARAQARGCLAWVSMASHADELVDAVERAAEGKLIGGHLGRLGQQVGLTPREVEVLSLVTQGLSNDAIAERLFVSTNTLKGHIRSAYKRIGVTTRSQAVAWAMQNGFLSAVG